MMIDTALNLPLFILLTLAYCLVIRALLFLLLQPVSSLYSRLHADEAGRADVALKIDTIGSILLSNLFLFFALWCGRDCGCLIRIWENPLFTAIVFIGLILNTVFFRFSHPLICAGANFAARWSWTILAVIVAGDIFPHLISETLFYSSVLTAGALMLLSGFRDLKTLPHAFNDFELLNRRHNAVGRDIKKLQSLTETIGTQGEWFHIRKLIEHAEEDYFRARKFLNGLDFVNAEPLIARLEAATYQALAAARDKIRLFLPADLKAHVAYSASELDRLKAELEKHGFETACLSDTAGRINEIGQEIGQDSISVEGLHERLGALAAAAEEISAIRSALRMHTDTGGALSSLKAEIATAAGKLKTAAELGLDTGQGQSIMQSLLSLIKLFESIRPGAIKNLLPAYTSLQNETTALRHELQALHGKISMGWDIAHIEEQDIHIYVPRLCATDCAQRGAVLAAANSGRNVRAHISASMLELSTPLLEIPTSRKDSPDIGIFSVSGKKSGKAIVNIRIDVEGEDEPLQPLSSTVWVNSGIMEQSVKALLGGGPTSAILLATLWGMGLNHETAATIGGAAGAFTSLLLFLVMRVRNRKTLT